MKISAFFAASVVIALAGITTAGRADVPAQTTAPPPDAVEPASDGYRNIVRSPDSVTVITEIGIVILKGGADAWTGDGTFVTTQSQADGMAIGLSASNAVVKKVLLHWKGALEGAGWKYLGDTWERSYGDLEWKSFDRERAMPWYVLASNGKRTHGYGVKTLPCATTRSPSTCPRMRRLPWC